MYDFNLSYTTCFDLATASQYERNATQDDFVNNLVGLLCESFDVPLSTAEAIAFSLLFRMGDSSLHYHTPVHILGIHQFYQNADNPPPLSNTQHLALWFHDAIYLPNAPFGFNETQSADFAAALLTPWLKSESALEVRRFIMATAFHDSAMPYPSTDEQILDLDIWSFSADYDTFLCMGELVRQEFAHISDKDFKKGRAVFIKKMADKPTIYRTPYFRENFEAKARDNIRCFLENMQ